MTRRELSAVCLTVVAFLWATFEVLDRKAARRELRTLKEQAVERGYAKPNPFRWSHYPPTEPASTTGSR